MVDRPNLFNVRLTDDELRMVRELAEHFGLNQSDTFRQLVRRAHAEQVGDRPRGKRPKRK